MSQDNRTPLQRLEELAGNMKYAALLRMTPLGEALPLILRWMRQTEEEQHAARDRDTVLARGVLSWHFGHGRLPRDAYASVATLARLEAEMVTVDPDGALHVAAALVAS